MKRSVTKTCSQRPAGFALLVTVIVLVVLASLTAGLATRLTMVKRRQQYMIEYQRTRYGLDSGIKFIISEMPLSAFLYEPRQDKPDFSDLFWMDQDRYNQFITGWAETATDEQIESVLKADSAMVEEQLDTASLFGKLASLFGGGSDSEPNEMEFDEDEQVYVVEIDPNDIQVPGPYGPPWPYAAEPIEMEIGSCDVTITIEDENAKMPLSWLVTKYEKTDKRSQYALERFGEWMLMGSDEIEELQTQCEGIFEKKEFRLNAGPIVTKKASRTSKTSRASSRRTAARSRRAKKKTATTKTKMTIKRRPAIAHTTDFAKLFHSSLLNRETLALSVIETEDRVENALKYLGIWGSQHVNVNTAPRHVLEAALTFSADDPEGLAEMIIEQRREKAFIKIDEIKKLGGLDTESFNKLRNYISTASTFFKVTVTSRIGNVRSRAVLTIVKEGRNAETLMVLYE